jgi:iron complex transport system substrate-binding protein
VHAVGAGDLLVGVSSWTDFPPEAVALPVVGDAFAVDQERLALLEPDLLLAWESGTAASIVDRLTARGFRVETVKSRSLDDIAEALERIGRLTGHEAQGRREAAEFREGLAVLARRYVDADPIRVFYQISRSPLYTVNGTHFTSQLIGVCGGRNVFADLDELAPLVDVEAVLVRDPEVMLASDDNGSDAFDVWQRWPDLAANRYGNRFLLPAGRIARATPRLLQAGEALCEALDRARLNRAGAADPR